MPVSISATSGARSPTAASIRAASRVVAKSDIIGRSDNSCSAPKLTSRPAQPTTLSLPTNFPILGLALCAAAQAYAINNVLLYGTLGLAYGNLDAQLGSLEENKTLVGWTGGLGMEVGFTPNWSAKVEYLYMDLGTRAYTITGVDNGLQASYLRLGVNYHF